LRNASLSTTPPYYIEDGKGKGGLYAEKQKTSRGSIWRVTFLVHKKAGGRGGSVSFELGRGGKWSLSRKLGETLHQGRKKVA